MSTDSMSLTLQTKVASALVHFGEYTSPNGHPLDLEAARALMADPEVAAWVQTLADLHLLPVKR